MVDFDCNGRVFDFDDVLYPDAIKKQDWELRFDAYKIHDQIMIIYIDIFGIENKEVKKLGDFEK